MSEKNNHAKNSNMPSLRRLALNNELLLKFEKVASEQGVALQQHCPYKPLNTKFTMQCHGLQMFAFGTFSIVPFLFLVSVLFQE